MKVLICPASFKGTLTAAEAAETIARAWREARPADEVRVLPLADGGEGTVEAILAATGGERREALVHDPLHRPVQASWAKLPDGTGVLEMAAASGLLLLGEAERDPEATSTHGTGELIRAALDAGCRTLRIGIGGSATTDGGAGAAAALGALFFDAAGRPLEPPLCGRDLSRIARVELSGVDSKVRETELLVACDVDNPLTGPSGAAAVYGPQKGATPEAVARLDAGLANLGRILAPYLVEHPGAGAAGGLGFGLMAFLGGKLVPGIETVLEAVAFERELEGCGLIITGEGNVDSQTLRGKVAAGVLRAARPRQIPVVLLAGGLEVDKEELVRLGVEAAWAVCDHAPSREAALGEPRKWLRETALLAARAWEG